MPLAHIHECHNCGGVQYFNIICTAVLAALLVNAFVQRYRKGKDNCCSCNECSIPSLNITVKGMNCNHCKSNVEAAIAKTAGVESVEIDLATGRTVVHGNPNKADVINAVEKLGFTVVSE